MRAIILVIMSDLMRDIMVGTALVEIATAIAPRAAPSTATRRYLPLDGLESSISAFLS